MPFSTHNIVELSLHYSITQRIKACVIEKIIADRFSRCCFKDFGIHLQVFEWILLGSMFKPDVGCFNMLMDAYGKNKQWTEAEKTFYLMKKFQCVPTVTSFNVLMAAYSRGGRLDKAEDLFHEMKDTNYTPGTCHDNFSVYSFRPYT